MKLFKNIGSGISTAANWVWKKTNGGKMIAGLAMHAVWAGANAKFGIVDTKAQIEGHLYIGSLTSTGAIHKLFKLFTKIKK